VSLRIYTSAEPRNLKIADLQKGLILVVNGTEAVGEGTGFGLSVLLYSDETYFSGSSRLYVSQRGDCCVVVKEFFMDRVARNSSGTSRWKTMLLAASSNASQTCTRSIRGSGF
jgi:hypothetical protein